MSSRDRTFSVDHMDRTFSVDVKLFGTERPGGSRFVWKDLQASTDSLAYLRSDDWK